MELFQNSKNYARILVKFSQNEKTVEKEILLKEAVEAADESKMAMALIYFSYRLKKSYKKGSYTL